MKVYYMSFTDILKRVKSDEYRTLDMVKDEVEFVLGCMPVHVFQENGLVPFEVTWLNTEKRKSFGGIEDSHGKRCTGVSRDRCDTEALAVWDSLLGILREKHEQGKVVWGNQIGKGRSYQDFARSATLMGHKVFYRGEVFKNRDELGDPKPFTSRGSRGL